MYETCVKCRLCSSRRVRGVRPMIEGTLLGGAAKNKKECAKRVGA
jgi:hypothetical protein